LIKSDVYTDSCHTSLASILILINTADPSGKFLVKQYSIVTQFFLKLVSLVQFLKPTIPCTRKC